MIPVVEVLSSIPQQEKSPTVLLLISIIEQQQAVIAQQQEEILLLKEKVEVLETEVRRLKKLPPKPKITSNLPKDEDDDTPDSSSHKDDPAGGSGQEERDPRKPRKRKKQLPIHKTEIIPPKQLPSGSRLLGYQDYTVQELIIKPHNIRYRLARYRTPDGKILIGELPGDLQGNHFGTTLRSYILYQHYHQRVTQPLIYKQLTEWGIEISSGQISNILTAGKEAFHLEKEQLLTAGINASSYIQVDDTGARHDGKNGYCTHIGNDAFAWFSSTDSKSRINFLKLLRGASLYYTLNESAYRYMASQGLPKAVLAVIQSSIVLECEDDEQWNSHLQQLQVSNKRHIRIATEGALLGTLSASGFPPDLVVLSDDAGQFNILQHALCWIHANRLFQKIIPLNETHAKALEWVQSWIWALYADLRQYKKAPNKSAKKAIELDFDAICQTKTSFETLNRALKRLAKNKKELLLVLDHPDIPLHNNLSERDIREYVIKRKISGSTRSKNGRRCRDTFISLIKTCKKQCISVWDFLKDRTSGENRIPYLPDLVSGNACLLKP